MDSPGLYVEVLDDHIILKSTGTLITTTWIKSYGDVLSSISKIKQSSKNQRELESLLNYNQQDAKKSHHKILNPKISLGINKMIGSSFIACYKSK